jgi:signal peptidase I
MAAPAWDTPLDDTRQSPAWDTAAPADDWEPVAPASTWEPAAPPEPAAHDAAGRVPNPSSGTLASADDDEPEPVSDWLDHEPASATRATGVTPIADDDPWEALDQAESEEQPVAGEPSVAAAASIEQPSPAAEVNGQASQSEPDDPWAAFLAGRQEAGEPVSAGPAWSEIHHEPEPVEPSRGHAEELDEPEDGTPWTALAAATGTLAAASLAADDAGMPSEPAAGFEPDVPGSTFARVHDSRLEDADDASADDASAEDDPWAAIAEASGVEPGSGEIAVFRPSARVEEALDRYEAEREAEEAEAALQPEAFPPAEDPEAMPLAERPAWDNSQVEDDTVLRAFERHASLYDEDHQLDGGARADTEPVVFDELLGEDADEIVAEASQQSPEARYFGRMHGWAPQRTPSGRQVFPWETDADDRERQQAQAPSDDDEEPVLAGWSRVEEPPPPWETASAAGHDAAPSQRHKSRSRMLVREIVETGLLALLVFLAVRASFQNFKVDGLSMSPTLEDGEYLIVNKLAYAEVDMDRLGNFVPFVEAGDDPTREVFGGPERGDIVVLQDPRDEDTDLIKRIIGLPGETLEIVDGEVYINDFKLEEPYIKQEWNGDKEKILIPDGYYFVMGDNRSNSHDSRSDDLGLISKDLIIGKAALTYWPSSKFGLAPNESGDISEQDGRPTITTQRVEE